MAEIEQVGNILIVSGDGLFDAGGEYRGNLRTILNASGTSPVKDGSHDFWLTFTPEYVFGANSVGEDLSTSPRKLRGICHIGEAPTTPDRFVDYLRASLEEVGHHWLVPEDLTFEGEDGTSISLVSAKETTRRINTDQSFGGPILLGRRDGGHWSGFFQADASPMDGLYYRREPEDGYDRWQQSGLRRPPPLSPRDLPTIYLQTPYNDLERVIMGFLEAGEAYPRSNSLTWLEPKLTAPLNYLVGIFVAFSRNDYLYFGFHRDHRTLAVQRTGSEPSVTVDLGPDYHPLLNAYNGVALRVVRRGNEYRFDARYDNPFAGCLTFLLRLFRKYTPNWLRRLVNRSMWEDLASPSNPTSSFHRFRTIEKRTIQETPQAVGMIIRRHDPFYFVEGSFYQGQFKLADREYILNTDRVPLRMSPGGLYSTLERERLYLDNPTRKAIVRSDGLRVRIAAPYVGIKENPALPDGYQLEFFEDPHPSIHFAHDEVNDNAPKLMARAPEEDFAFGTSCRVERTIVNPWGYGDFVGKTMWGVRRSMPISGIRVPDYIKNNKWDLPGRTPEDEKTYKCAFILAARERSQVTDEMIRRLDELRQYWDVAFEPATGDARKSDSTL